MYKRILLALDLEGVNLVAGEPYMGLVRDSEGWEIARHQAALEINAAADALFAAGAELVSLWDNHGGGENVVPAELDARIDLIPIEKRLPRMCFIDDYDCICFFGYHAMEGTLGGVLAHTMSSKNVQYYKINGRYVGEVDIDAYIAAAHGVPSCFFAGGNIACAQAARAVEGIATVVTKQELSRNEAVYRENRELLEEIRHAIVDAVSKQHTVAPLTFPAVLEKSFKRVEDAKKYLQKLCAIGMNSEYLDDEILGKDAHTVVTQLSCIDDLVKSI